MKCWGVILLSSGPLSYQSGRHHGLWARQVGTRGGYVGIGTKILGRPHYFSFTSYTPPPCNHPSCHDIAPSLCHLYPRSCPLSSVVHRRCRPSFVAATIISSLPLSYALFDCCVFLMLSSWSIIRRCCHLLSFATTIVLLTLPCTV